MMIRNRRKLFSGAWLNKDLCCIACVYVAFIIEVHTGLDPLSGEHFGAHIYELSFLKG